MIIHPIGLSNLCGHPIFGGPGTIPSRVPRVPTCVSMFPIQNLLAIGKGGTPCRISLLQLIGRLSSDNPLLLIWSITWEIKGDKPCVLVARDIFTGQLGSTADCMGKRAPVWAMEPKPVGALWLGWTNCSTLSQSPGTTLRPKLKSAGFFFASNQIEKTPCVSKAFVQKNYSTVNLAPRKSAWQKFRVKQLQGGRVYYFQWSNSSTHNPWIVSSTGSSPKLGFAQRSERYLLNPALCAIP